MVAPIQGSVGHHSTDPVVQDNLNELTNFYNKPENEGIESEFTTPDGSKFKIQDASYLAKVKSNVNTGQYDNKSVDQDADTKVGSYEAEKKAKAGKDKEQAPVDADAARSKAESGGNFSLTDSFSINAKMSSTVDKGNQSIAKQQAELPKSKAALAKLSESITNATKAKNDSIKSLQQGDAKLAAVSTQLEAKADQAVAKASAKVASKQSAQVEEDSTTQSGSKMGFEGKLATEAPASTGNGGGNGSEGGSKVDAKKAQINATKAALKAEGPKVKNAIAIGDKSAQPLLAQAAQSKTLADGAMANKEVTISNGRGEMAVEGAGATACGAVAALAGIGAFIGWTCRLPALLSGPWTWGAALAEAAIDTVATAVALGAGYGAYKCGAAVKDTADDTDAKIADMRTEEAGYKNQATQQTAGAGAIKTQAAAQVTVQNTRIMRAQQALGQKTQEISGDLSSSSMGAINTDGMNEEQLESVKKERYDQIMAHEQEHASVIGGTPVIETDSNGVAVGGYVDIDVPSVDESDLEGTVEKAQLVIDAALAPSDPSSQDQNIASQAKDVLSRAQDMMEEKAAKAKKEEEKKPEEKKEEPKKEEVKEEAKKAA